MTMGVIGLTKEDFVDGAVTFLAHEKDAVERYSLLHKKSKN